MIHSCVNRIRTHTYSENPIIIRFWLLRITCLKTDYAVNIIICYSAINPRQSITFHSLNPLIVHTLLEVSLELSATIIGVCLSADCVEEAVLSL